MTLRRVCGPKLRQQVHPPTTTLQGGQETHRVPQKRGMLPLATTVSSLLVPLSGAQGKCSVMRLPRNASVVEWSNWYMPGLQSLLHSCQLELSVVFCTGRPFCLPCTLIGSKWQYSGSHWWWRNDVTMPLHYPRTSEMLIKLSTATTIPLDTFWSRKEWHHCEWVRPHRHKIPQITKRPMWHHNCLPGGYTQPSRSHVWAPSLFRSHPNMSVKHFQPHPGGILRPSCYRLGIWGYSNPRMPSPWIKKVHCISLSHTHTERKTNYIMGGGRWEGEALPSLR